MKRTPSVVTTTHTITYTYAPLGRLTDADYRSTANLRFALTAGSTGESYGYTHDAADRLAASAGRGWTAASGG